jgi:hypothetical protein
MTVLYLKIWRHQLEIWWSQIELTGDALAEPVNGYLWPLNRRDNCIAFEFFTDEGMFSLFTHPSADYRLCHLVNHVTIQIYTHDYIRMEITVLYLKISMSIATLLTRWRKRLKFEKYLMLFKPWNWYRKNNSIVQSQTRNIKQLH